MVVASSYPLMLVILVVDDADIGCKMASGNDGRRLLILVDTGYMLNMLVENDH